MQLYCVDSPLAQICLALENSILKHRLCNFYFLGVREPHISKAIVSAVRHFPKAWFLDLGANLGVHSLTVAKTGRQVVAVEPMPGTFLHLQMSVKRNNFNDHFILVKNAVFNERKTVVMQGFNDTKGKYTY